MTCSNEAYMHIHITKKVITYLHERDFKKAGVSKPVANMCLVLQYYTTEILKGLIFGNSRFQSNLMVVPFSSLKIRNLLSSSKIYSCMIMHLML